MEGERLLGCCAEFQPYCRVFFGVFFFLHSIKCYGFSSLCVFLEADCSPPILTVGYTMEMGYSLINAIEQSVIVNPPKKALGRRCLAIHTAPQSTDPRPSVYP